MKRRDWSETGRFVIGTLNEQDIIDNVHATQLHRYSDVHGVTIKANHVMVQDGTPWVVHDETKIATPLIVPERFTNPHDSFWSKPIEKVIAPRQD